MNTTNCVFSGRELYHAIWKAIAETFYDETRLLEWGSWEHRFDDVINSDETAIRFARETIASLDDPYTRLRVRQVDTTTQPAQADETQQAGTTSAGAGERVSNVSALITKDNIGYLRILSFEDPKIVHELVAAAGKLAGCNGLILDLRHNAGGLMHEAIECCELFVSSGTVATVETRSANGITRRIISLNPNVCLWSDETADGKSQTSQFKRLKPLLAGKPIAILLSRKTASATELFACAIIVNGFAGMCVSIGATTLGKGIGQSEWLDILGKVELRVTCLRWFAPNGEWLGDGNVHTDGIEPDLPVLKDRGPEGLTVAKVEMRKMVADLRRAAQALKPAGADLFPGLN